MAGFADVGEPTEAVAAAAALQSQIPAGMSDALTALAVRLAERSETGTMWNVLSLIGGGVTDADTRRRLCTVLADRRAFEDALRMASAIETTGDAQNDLLVRVWCAEAFVELGTAVLGARLPAAELDRWAERIAAAAGVN